MKHEHYKPTGGELDCLTVLWNCQNGNDSAAMRLSEVRRAVVERRRSLSEPEPALSTVSTYLRSAVAKGLLEEVRVGKDGAIINTPGDAGRGALARIRSPQTAYRPAVTPREVFRGTLQAIAGAYPNGQELALLVDVASILGVPQQVRGQIERWVQRRIGQQP